MRELARLATILARPDMERRTRWRFLLGGDRWAVILLTRGRPGEPPEPTGPAPLRLHPRWLAKTGKDLSGEDLLYLRVYERLRAHGQDAPVPPETAASIAAEVCAEMARNGLDLTTGESAR